MKTFMLFKRVLIASVLLCFCSFQSIWAQKTIVVGDPATSKPDVDIAKFQNLLDDIAKGSYNGSGPITLALEKGQYSLPQEFIVNMANTKEQLTITSVAKDAKSVILAFKGNAFFLDDAHGLTIQDITIDATAGCGILFKNACSDVEIRGCKFIGEAKGVDPNCMGITTGDPNYDAGFPLKQLRIIGNTFDGGNNSIVIRTGMKTPFDDILIDSNICSNMGNHGIYVRYGNKLVVSNNIITHNPVVSTTQSYCTGMFISDITETQIVSNNINLITVDPCNPEVCGLYLGEAAMNKGDNPVFVANNAIATFNNNNMGDGFEATVFMYGNIQFYHNSIHQMGDGECLFSAKTPLVNFDMQGNLFVNSTPKTFPIFIDNNNQSAWQGSYKANYNSYYNLSGKGEIAIFNGNNCFQMAELQKYGGDDANSTDAPVKFIDPKQNLKLADYTPVTMPNVTGLKTDIEGNARSQKTTMGAYGITTPATDAALKQFVDLNKIMASAPGQVSVVVVNKGTSPLSKATITLLIDGVAQTPYAYAPATPLAQDKEETVVVGSFKISAGNHVFTAFIDVPGDADHSNDTIAEKANICGQAYSGSFVINSIAQFDSLINEFSTCGAGGDITMAFANGNYTVTKALALNTAFMNGNHLTITSVAKDRDSVTFTGKLSEMIKFNNTNNVTFSHITLDNAAGSGRTIHIDGGAENVTFFACNILATLTGSGGSNNAISYGDAAPVTKKIRNLHFINNNISGGCRNSIVGSATIRLSGIRFEGNTISGSYGNCLNIQYADSVYVCNNRISIRNGGVDSWPTGLILSQSTADSVCNNYIDMSTGNFTRTAQSGSALSIGSDCFSTAKGRMLVANNVLIGKASTGWRAGTGTGKVCKLTNSDVKFVFNSIYNLFAAYKPTGAYTAGVFVLCVEESSSATKAPDCYVYGNQVITFDDKNQYPLLVNLTNGTLKGDYNNFYTAGKTIAYWNTQATDILTIQKDQPNSICKAVSFVDSTKGLQLKNYSDFMVPNIGINTDYEGTLRGKTTPMGAYTDAAPAAPADAALAAFIGLDKITAAAPGQVSVVVVNKDTANAIQTATITLLVDGVAQTPYTYAPATPLACGMMDTVAIGSFKIAAGDRIFTAFIDVQGDSIHSNDTIVDKAHICAQAYSGSFVINSIAQFDSLINEFSTCGANGDITMAFANGSYNWTKALEINTAFMNGNRLTITSVAKDRDSVIFECNVSLNNAGFIKLNNTNNVTFSHISLQMKNANGHTVCFYGPTDGVTFYHCNIAVTSGGTDGGNCCFGAKGNNTDIAAPVKNFKLIGNNITAGCRNSIKGTATNRIQGFRLDSNSITNAYDGSFTLNYADDIAINFNTVIPKTGTQWPAGISLSNVTGDSIYGNLVNFGVITRTNFGGNALSVSGDITSPKRMLIANNVFIGHNDDAYKKSNTTNPAISKVVYLNSINCDFVHNSIYNTRSSCVPTGKYTNKGVVELYLAGNGSDVKCVGNQIISYNAKNQYPLYVDASIKNFTADYNNYYSGDTVIAIYNGDGQGAGTLIPTVAALAKVTGGDAHSVSIAPQFVDLTQGLQLKNYADYVMPNIGLNADYLNVTRGKQTTMGAYTDAAPAAPVTDAALVSFITPNAQSIMGVKTPIVVVLTNKGTDTLRSAEIGFNTGSLLMLQPTPWNGKLATGQSDTVTLGNNTTYTPKIGSTLTVFLLNPNGLTKDDDPSNDTLRITFGATTPANDAALTSIVSPAAQVTPGVAVPVSVVLTNKGTNALTSASISYVFNNAMVLKPYNWTGNLAAGQSVTLQITTVTPVAGQNTLKLTVSNVNGLKADDDPSNDVLNYTFTGIAQKVLDIEVTQLVSPDANSFVGISTPLKVKMTNVGTDTVKSFNIVNIYGATKARTNTWTGMLLPKQDTTIYLRDVTPNKGINTVEIYVRDINGTGLKDNNQKNDTLKLNLNITREPGDASLTEFIGLEKVNPNVGVPVYVVVYNKGTKAIDKATINFSINGVAQKAYTYQPKVALAQSKFDTVNLGFFTAKAGKTTFIASITMTDDMEPSNDTIRETREVYFTDYKLNEIVSPKAITEATCFGDKMPIAIAVSNTGKLDADFAANPMKISVSVSGAYKYQLDTAIEKGLLKANALDTFLLGFIPTTAVGSYTINVTLGGDADYDNTNNDAKAGFDVTSIAIPYDNDLSSATKELVFNQVGKVHWDYVSGTSHIAVAPVYGKGYLEFAGEKEKGAKASIVMNGVHIQNFTNPKLSFWYAHTAAKDQGDILVVKATTDGGATYTTLGKLAPAAAKDEWKRYDFDLNKFSSEKCLSIVLEATSAGMNQGIDRIVLTAEQDAAISLIPTDMSSYAACSNDPVDVKAVVTNVSDMDVELTNDTIIYNVNGAIQASGKYVYTKTLKAKTADTITVGQFVPAKNGRYFVEVIMQSQDDKAANDTVRDSSLFVMQDLALIGLDGIDDQTVRTAGDTVNVKALLVNTGNTVIRSSKLQVKVNGNEVDNLTANNVIGIGDTVEQELSYIVPFATKANPTYTLEVNAGFDCDGDSTNNSIQLVGQVNVPDTIDVQVLDILVSDTMGKAQVKPTVRIANIANVDAANVKLHVMVYDSADNMIADIAGTIETIGMNDTIDYACDSAYTVPNYNGMYRLVAFVEANANDNNLNNDTLNRQLNCHLDDTRISESSDMNWNMGQNYPNPASNVTRIPFTMTQDATVVFSVMSVNGQMIYREVLSASAGSNTVDFNVDNLANGVYYYSMECNGQRFVKKMNVAR